ncbi:MAG: hypothetical protein ACJ8F7_14940, partial [Gemmataceae bacterium]
VDVQLVREARGRIPIGHMIHAPIILTFAGFCLGVAAACLFAPTDFLAGPVGRKWMEFSGTQGVYRARVVCFFVCLALLAATIIGSLFLLFFPK